MASRADPDFQTLTDNRKIMVKRLPPCHLEFIENVIIGTAYKNPCLFQSDLFYQLKVLLICPDPACNFRKLISFLQTLVNSIPVFFTVKEKLTLTDLSLWTAQTVQVVINRHNLLCRIRRSGLLPVTECCIRNPDLVRH